MKKTITKILLGAAMFAPLAVATPAQAQSLGRIQRLEERVNEAKANGDWNAAGSLERELNRERLRYQQRHGMGEYQENPYYNNYYYNGNPNRYPNLINRPGYYDQWGNWHRY